MKQNPRPVPQPAEQIIRERLERTMGLLEKAGIEVDPASVASKASPPPAGASAASTARAAALQFLQAKSPTERIAAATAQPQLANAFALEAALNKFAAETFSKAAADRFMRAQRQLIAGRLKAGETIPVVNIRDEEREAVREANER